MSLRIRLDARVRAQENVSWGKARSLIETGKVFVEGRAETDAGLLVGSDDPVEIRMNARRADRANRGPEALDRGRVVFEDADVIVVEKPAGLSTVPFDDTEKDSLLQRVEALLRQEVFVVQRLDRETSGLLVFARNRDSARGLESQFRRHSVHRRYLAVAQGRVEARTVRSVLVKDRGDGLRGSLRPGVRAAREEMKEAVTHVTPLKAWADCTLVECRLETGRTHQIRIHLSEGGNPLVGEKVYVREYRGGKVEGPRLLLHAHELGFEHPRTGRPLQWRSAPPEDFERFTAERDR